MEQPEDYGSNPVRLVMSLEFDNVVAQEDLLGSPE
jgi:hypothetical protein